MKTEKSKAEVTGTQIVVMDRGFVYVGQVSIKGDMVTISGAKNIRRWGTTKGLGELVNGPIKGSTVTDHVGEVKATLRSVIHFIKCNGGW